MVILKASIPLLVISMTVNNLKMDLERILYYFNVFSGFLGLHFYLHLCTIEGNSESEIWKNFVVVEILCLILPLLLLLGQLMLKIRGFQQENIL